MALKKTDDMLLGYLDARRSHFRILLRQVVGSLGLQTAGSAALLAVGAVLVIKNQLTLGQLVAAEIVVTNILNSLTKFQKQLEAFYDLAAALDKIEGLMELPLEKDPEAEYRAGQGPARLTLREVEYGYEGSRFRLRIPSLELPPGRKLALQGADGTGKSTILDLVFGIKNPTAGSLQLDGNDYRDFGKERLRQDVLLVRGAELISASVLENIAFGRSLTPAEATAALAMVGMKDTIARLPDGIHTQLGDNGAPLSFTQAQKLVLARAIAGRPRLLLIDECLDSLEPEAAASILETLLAKEAPWTLILGTSDPAIARRCEQVLPLENFARKEGA